LSTAGEDELYDFASVVLLGLSGCGKWKACDEIGVELHG
jgi:hypothetical protein